MRRRPSAALLVAALAFAVSGCGGSSSHKSPPCAVLSNGNQLCGNALVTWCELENVALNQAAYPIGSPTNRVCATASRWQTRGQKVTNITP